MRNIRCVWGGWYWLCCLRCSENRSVTAGVAGHMVRRSSSLAIAMEVLGSQNNTCGWSEMVSERNKSQSNHVQAGAGFGERMGGGCEMSARKKSFSSVAEAGHFSCATTPILATSIGAAAGFREKTTRVGISNRLSTSRSSKPRSLAADMPGSKLSPAQALGAEP